MDLLFADVTLSVATPVFKTVISTRYHSGVWFVDVTALGTLFEGIADGFDVETPSLQVVVVTLVSEEFSVTQ